MFDFIGRLVVACVCILFVVGLLQFLMQRRRAAKGGELYRGKHVLITGRLCVCFCFCFFVFLAFGRHVMCVRCKARALAWGVRLRRWLLVEAPS